MKLTVADMKEGYVLGEGWYGKYCDDVTGPWNSKKAMDHATSGEFEKAQKAHASMSIAVTPRLSREVRISLIVSAAVRLANTHGLSSVTTHNVIPFLSNTISEATVRSYFTNERLRKLVSLHKESNDDVKREASEMGIT
jgi:hypothetical protein